MRWVLLTFLLHCIYPRLPFPSSFPHTLTPPPPSIREKMCCFLRCSEWAAPPPVPLEGIGGGGINYTTCTYLYNMILFLICVTWGVHNHCIWKAMRGYSFIIFLFYFLPFIFQSPPPRDPHGGLAHTGARQPCHVRPEANRGVHPGLWVHQGGGVMIRYHLSYHMWWWWMLYILLLFQCTC